MLSSLLYYRKEYHFLLGYGITLSFEAALTKFRPLLGILYRTHEGIEITYLDDFWLNHTTIFVLHESWLGTKNPPEDARDEPGKIVTKVEVRQR